RTCERFLLSSFPDPIDRLGTLSTPKQDYKITTLNPNLLNFLPCERATTATMCGGIDRADRHRFGQQRFRVQGMSEGEVQCPKPYDRRCLYVRSRSRHVSHSPRSTCICYRPWSRRACCTDLFRCHRCLYPR